MIWNILQRTEHRVLLPLTCNVWTTTHFISEVIDEQRDAKFSKVIFDFSRVNFVEPVGIVALSNLIEYFKKIGCSVAFANHSTLNQGTKFLDDSQFFERYLKKKVFESSSVRSTTMPLRLIESDRAQEYLLYKLMPWVASSVNMSTKSLESIRVSIEEILHNVKDHSGVGIGCTFAQHFPKKKTIEIAISDFGNGIPNVVRKKLPNTLDSDALKLASQEGFTTQSNVQNRGAGLPTLIKFVASKNGGSVRIVSGNGSLSAAPSSQIKTGINIVARSEDAFYPGTLVRVMLRTDTLEDVAAEVVEEDFEW
jgi:anti-sigma regulatory factor (Ser/Thr protein kinase)/anti-anti-sigma regulatory factor